jgi:DNA-binding response OmpR family regulator
MAKKAKILIIDDEPDFCHFMKMNLKTMTNFKVYTANSGKSGFKMAVKKKPDIIFLDIIMPKSDGFDTLQLLKQDPDTMSIPVIMLTALDQEELQTQASSLYSEDYLRKPIGMDLLLSKIEQVLAAKPTYKLNPG